MIQKDSYDFLEVTDWQGDFNDGVLKNDAAIVKEDAVIAEIDNFEGDVIIATRDTHDKDTYGDSVEGQNLPIHCVRGTPGWEITPRVQEALDRAKAAGKTVKYVDKSTFGFLGWPKVLFDIDSTDQEAVHALLRGKKIRIRIIGTCSNICNMSAAVIQRAWFPMADIEFVDGASAPSGLTPEEVEDNQKAALTIATSMLCKVVPTVYKG